MDPLVGAAQLKSIGMLDDSLRSLPIHVILWRLIQRGPEDQFDVALDFFFFFLSRVPTKE